MSESDGWVVLIWEEDSSEPIKNDFTDEKKARDYFNKMMGELERGNIPRAEMMTKELYEKQLEKQKWLFR